MKLTLALLILLPSFTFASSPSLPRMPSPGMYSYSGNFSTSQRRREEVVNSIGQEGKNRLAQLKSDGYACMHKSNGFYLCSAFLEPKGQEQQLEELVNKDLKDKSANFSAPDGAPELRYSAESYEEWLAPQKVQFAGKVYQNYRIAILKSSAEQMHKLVFGEPAETGFVQNEGDALTFVSTYMIRESKDARSVYLVQAEYKLNP